MKPVIAIGAGQYPLQNVRAPLADELAELFLHCDGIAIRPEGLSPPELRAVPLAREQCVQVLVEQDVVGVSRPLLGKQEGVEIYTADLRDSILRSFGYSLPGSLSETAYSLEAVSALSKSSQRYLPQIADLQVRETVDSLHY